MILAMQMQKIRRVAYTNVSYKWNYHHISGRSLPYCEKVSKYALTYYGGGLTGQLAVILVTKRVQTSALMPNPSDD